MKKTTKAAMPKRAPKARPPLSKMTPGLFSKGKTGMQTQAAPKQARGATY